MGTFDLRQGYFYWKSSVRHSAAAFRDFVTIVGEKRFAALRPKSPAANESGSVCGLS